MSLPHFTLPPARPFSKMFEAVLTANDDEHRRRRLLMPVVQKSAMDHYRDIFVETFQSSRFCASAGTRFDIWHELMEISKANMARRCLAAAFAEVQTRVILGLLAAQPLQPRLLTSSVDHRMKSGVAAAPRKPVMVELGTPGAPRLPITATATSFRHP